MEKPSFGEKFRALLATGRVANLPTVWSNVLVAFWFGSNLAPYSEYEPSSGMAWFRPIILLFAFVAATSIYLAGCMLGDAKDVEFDREHRPNRPIPRGVLSAPKIAFLSYLMFGFALVAVSASTYIAALVDWAAREDITLNQALSTFTDKTTLFTIQPHEIIVTITLCIIVILYAFFHKRSRILGLPLISASRFLLVIFAVAVSHKTFLDFTAAGSNDPLQLHTHWLTPWAVYLALAVGCHTLLLSWVASTESQPGLFTRRKLLTLLMMAVPLSVYAFNAALPRFPSPNRQWGSNYHMEETFIAESHPHTIALILCLFICYAWLAYAFHGLKTSKPAFVSRALAGFCLLDACFAAAYAPGISIICIVLFGLALILQRVTPAT